MINEKASYVVWLYFHFPCMFSEYQNQRWDHGATFWSHCYGWMHQHFWHGMALSNVLTKMKQGWIIQNLNVLKVVEKDGWGGGHMVQFSFFSKQGSCLRFDWNSPTWLSYNCLSWNELTGCKILTHLKFAPKVSKTFHPFNKKKLTIFSTIKKTVRIEAAIISIVFGWWNNKYVSVNVTQTWTEVAQADWSLIVMWEVGFSNLILNLIWFFNSGKERRLKHHSGLVGLSSMTFRAQLSEVTVL